MATLHTVNRSPFERPSLARCLEVARAGSSVLLIEDGVYAALAGTEPAAALSAAAGTLTIYALGPDLVLRGIAPSDLVGEVQVVDYNGFVELAVSCERVQSWL